MLPEVHTDEEWDAPPEPTLDALAEAWFGHDG
jgi:hypothetical protein